MAIPQQTNPGDDTQLLFDQAASLARVFASTTVLKTETGSATTSEALENDVYDWDVLDPSDVEFEKARVLIRMASNRRQEVAQTEYSTQCTLEVSIERKQDEPATETNSAIRTSKETFMRWVSQLMTEVEGILAARSTEILGFRPIACHTYELTDGPDMIPKSEITGNIDESDVTEPASKKAKVIWWVEFMFIIG